MKKFAIAAVTAIVAITSFSGAAEARRRHDDFDFGGRRHHDDWGRHNRHDIDVIVFRPHCSTTKIIKFNDSGDKIVKIIKSC